jgi:pimeloyl-ACP methyl ester carboxylesterase
MIIWLNRLAKGLAVLLLSLVFFLILMFRSDIPVEEAEEKYQTPESHYIEVDGVNVHVRFLGDGEPVVLLHGSFASLHTWETWQQAMSPYFMTIAIDLPGHGLTGPDPKKRYSTKDYSQLVLRLMEELNIEKFHLAGNSMGGAVALQIASSHPDKVLSLNLIDASGTPRSQQSIPESQKPSSNVNATALLFKALENPILAQIFLKCTPKFLFAMNLKQVYADESKITEKTLDRYYELMLREGNRKATIDRLMMPKGMSVDFDRLIMPTLILWGENDTWIPVSQGHLFEKLIKGSKMIVFSNTGHVPMEEIPAESVGAYLSFLGIEIRKDYPRTPNYVSYAD